MQIVSNNKQIAKNTMLLYTRMLFVMLISLFTSRINLNSLGETDYGIYNVVGGVVAMFSVFSGSLSTAISRYITYELGKKDLQKLKRVFSTAVVIQICLAVIIFFLAEIIGVWFLYNKMTIPAERMDAAFWVMQCSILTFVVNLISVPYNAAIIAHERMSAFAYIGLFEVVVKLIICYSLFITPADRLVTFAVLLLILAIVIRILYGAYCKKHFEECSFSFVYDKGLLKSITGFAGWSSFTLVAYTLYTSGLNVLLNMFFGPVMNAAQAISFQVQTAVQGFCRNFQVALNPQLIKSYAEENLSRTKELLFAGSKYSFFLVYFIGLPILLGTDTILSVWLEKVPAHTDYFIRIVVVIMLIDTIGGPLYTVQQASGRIRNFQIVTGSLMMMILPVSYISLKLGGKPESVYYVYAIILAIVQLVSILMVSRTVGFRIMDYFHKVMLRILMVVLITLPIAVATYVLLPKGLMSFLLVSAVCCVVNAAMIYFVGLESGEKIFVKDLIKKKLSGK